MIYQIVPRVVATPAASELIADLASRHGALAFSYSSQSGDPGLPLCLPAESFMPGLDDVCMGVLDGVPFYIHYDQFEAWKDCRLVLDAVTGPGAGSSLEHGSGKQFVAHIRELDA